MAFGHFFLAKNNKFKESRPPETLRWTKADNGTNITWSYNNANNPSSITEPDIRATILEILFSVSSICNVQFSEGVIGSSDIDIQWDTTGDGLNMTLAFVFQPVSGNNMAVCTPVCGDVNTDVAENWTLDDLHNVIMHEVGHSLGLPHTEFYLPPVESPLDSTQVMFPFYSFGSQKRVTWGLNDIQELQRRYPF